MSTEKFEGLEKHPVIATQEKSKETIVELKGFAGTATDNTLRLYADLEMSLYVDIPKDAIIHIEKAHDSPKGLVSVFVLAAKEVTEIRQVTANLSSFTAHLNTPLPNSMLPWLKCQNKCELSYTSDLKDVFDARLEVLILAKTYGLGDPRVDAARQRATLLENRAYVSLQACLSQCPKNPFFSPEELASRIAVKYSATLNPPP